MRKLLHIGQLEKFKDCQDGVNIIQVVVLEDGDAALWQVDVIKKGLECSWSGILDPDWVFSSTCEYLQDISRSEELKLT